MVVVSADMRVGRGLGETVHEQEKEGNLGSYGQLVIGRLCVRTHPVGDEEETRRDHASEEGRALVPVEHNRESSERQTSRALNDLPVPERWLVCLDEEAHAADMVPQNCQLS
eukprot:scaffold112_cov337-Pinguiococcus_pyrenoidosus.AAC.1